MLNLVL
jgi:hypothetical protein